MEVSLEERGLNPHMSPDADSVRRRREEYRERLRKIEAAKRKKEEFYVAPIPKRGDPVPGTGKRPRFFESNEHILRPKKSEAYDTRRPKARIAIIEDRDQLISKKMEAELRKASINKDEHIDRATIRHVDENNVPYKDAHRPRIIGSKKTIEGRAEGWDSKKRLEVLKDKDLERGQRSTDILHDYKEPEYNESRLDEVNNGITKDDDEFIKDPPGMNPEELKRYSAERQRQADILEMNENRAKRGEPLSRKERVEEKTYKETKNFGNDKHPYRKGSHVTKILK